MDKIDFVLLWVDGEDPAWKEEYNQYSNDNTKKENGINRFRDWGLLKYWFRGVEKYAPWVNKIYLVTWGHYPEWLDLENPKLKLVKHSDYIPSKYLPTFNSNVIELHLHRITELSEKFVLFNDDTFLTKTVTERDFFRNNFPCETALLGQIAPINPDDIFLHSVLNNTAIINSNFSKKEVIRRNWTKFFSIKYRGEVLRNVLLCFGRYFSCFRDLHLPAAYLKSTFKSVWEVEGNRLEKISENRFRKMNDISHWLMKQWQICEGKFYPRDIKWGKCFEIGRDVEAYDAIARQKYKLICVNDCDPALDFGACQKALIDSFEKILPEKSGFEK